MLTLLLGDASMNYRRGKGELSVDVLCWNSLKELLPVLEL